MKTFRNVLQIEAPFMRAACAGRLMVLSVLLVAPCGAIGQQLVYKPVNPSFGGSPLNASHLLATANAQKKLPRSPTRTSAGGLGSQGDSDLFLRQLKSRLLSSLATQVSQAIFGDDPQEAGTVTFGDQTVTFERTLDSIRLVVLDQANGSETVIEVPVLVAE